MRRPSLQSDLRFNLRFGAHVSSALATLVVVVACVLDACAPPPPPLEKTESPIFGGTPDTTHDAVMALIDQMSSTTASACTGTTIALSGASGILLTAGHCVVANDGMGHITKPLKVADPSTLFVVPGPDWHTNVSNGLYYGVGDVIVHPMYDGAVDSPFDVAIVRFLGALPASPVIPALTPAEDKLMPGTAIDIVGFGKTETDAMNTTRFEVPRAIDTITDSQFTYTQMDSKGACSGDSGGPALVDTPDGLRVGGITSFGDPDCTKVGASVRVSPVFDKFIQAFLSDCLPKTLSCDECTLAAVGPGNSCVDASKACATSTTPCGQFLACADACTTQTCASQCQRANAQGFAAYNAVVMCQCTACSTECGKTCGGTGNPVGPSPACSLGNATTGTAGSGGAGSGGTVVPSGTGGQMRLTSSGGCSVADGAGPSWAVAALLALAFALARSRAAAPARRRR